MTKQQQLTMQRILDMKMCSVTGRLLSGITFGIYMEEENGSIYYRLYRLVDGVKDKCPLVSSTSIHEVYVYYGPIMG